MSFTQSEILTTMKETGVVPVFFNGDVNIAKKIFDSCYAGGIRVFEFTNRGPNAFEVFTALKEHQKKYSDAILGIGTIMNADDTNRFIDAAADFIVSPILKEEMGEICVARDKLWVPGCATLTEIVRAHETGAGVVKVFPASVLGPGFVSAIKPVVPAIKIMPTGGIEPDQSSVDAWLNAGVLCIGMGSQLLKADLIKSEKWDVLTSAVQKVLSLVKIQRTK